MKRSMGLWQLLGFAVTSLTGTLLHFLYDWTNESVWAATFSGVNESTWEHMKLLFWPTFLFAIVQYYFFRDRQNFWCLKLRGILLGLSLIPVIFYTYNGVIGKSPDWLNVTIFFVSATIAYAYEYKQFQKEKAVCKSPRLAFSLLCLIGLLFVLFTFKTPHLGIFQDPISGAFGI